MYICINEAILVIQPPRNSSRLYVSCPLRTYPNEGVWSTRAQYHVLMKVKGLQGFVYVILCRSGCSRGSVTPSTALHTKSIELDTGAVAASGLRAGESTTSTTSTARNIGGELYLADWRISCHTANIVPTV